MSLRKTVRIGTRGSALARTQAQAVADALQSRHPHLSFETVIIETLGDRRHDLALHRLDAAGVFVKEIEEALLDGRIDLAVHSAKDLPSRRPEGLSLIAFPHREDPRDALVLRGQGAARHRPSAEGPAPQWGIRSGLRDVPGLVHGSRVGTSSVRRRAVLLHHCPRLDILPVRGNVDTRLGRLEEGDYDALILAAAGLIRLERQDRIAALMDPADMIPAVAQGALALEARAGEDDLAALVRPLNHAATDAEVRAERAFLSVLGGDCAVPLGALARVTGEDLEIRGFVAGMDGAPYLEGVLRGRTLHPEQAGRALAEDLLNRGAGAVLKSLTGAPAVPRGGGTPEGGGHARPEGRSGRARVEGSSSGAGSAEGG